MDTASALSPVDRQIASGVFTTLHLTAPGGHAFLPLCFVMAAAREMGYYPTTQFLQRSISAVVGNADRLTFTDFLQLCTILEETRLLDDLVIESYRRAFDIRGTGWLSRNEFRVILATSAAMELSPSEVEATVDILDPKGTGIIQLTELEDMLRQCLLSSGQNSNWAKVSEGKSEETQCWKNKAATSQNVDQVVSFSNTALGNRSMLPTSVSERISVAYGMNENARQNMGSNSVVDDVAVPSCPLDKENNEGRPFLSYPSAPSDAEGGKDHSMRKSCPTEVVTPNPNNIVIDTDSTQRVLSDSRVPTSSLDSHYTCRRYPPENIPPIGTVVGLTHWEPNLHPNFESLEMGCENTEPSEKPSENVSRSRRVDRDHGPPPERSENVSRSRRVDRDHSPPPERSENVSRSRRVDRDHSPPPERSENVSRSRRVDRDHSPPPERSENVSRSRRVDRDHGPPPERSENVSRSRRVDRDHSPPPERSENVSRSRRVDRDHGPPPERSENVSRSRRVDRDHGPPPERSENVSRSRRVDRDHSPPPERSENVSRSRRVDRDHGPPPERSENVSRSRRVDRDHSPPPERSENVSRSRRVDRDHGPPPEKSENVSRSRRVDRDHGPPPERSENVSRSRRVDRDHPITVGSSRFCHSAANSYMSDTDAEFDKSFDQCYRKPPTQQELLKSFESKCEDVVDGDGISYQQVAVSPGRNAAVTVDDGPSSKFVQEAGNLHSTVHGDKRGGVSTRCCSMF